MTSIAKSPAAAGDVSSAADVAFDRCWNHIQAMSGKEIADTAKQLFPHNKYQRIAFGCYIKSLQNKHQRHINPRTYPVKLISEPGEGKSAIVYDFGYKLEDWLSAIAGEHVPFHVVTRTLAGVNDLAELLGIIHVDHVVGVSKIFPFADLPCGKHTKAFGLFFADDYNRGEDQAIAGLMELVNREKYNNFELAMGFAVATAVNPSGTAGANRVRREDLAQYTRFVPLAYAPSRDGFYQNLVDQGLDGVAVAYAIKFKDQASAAPSPAASDVRKWLPEPRPVNKRNYTMFWHLFDVFQHDEECLVEVAGAMLGEGNIKNLLAMLEGDMPVEPREVVGYTRREIANGEDAGTNHDTRSPESAAKYAISVFAKWERERKTDLVNVSLHRLCTWLNTPTTNLADDQVDALCTVLCTLSKEQINVCMRKLIMDANPRWRDYRPKFFGWKSEDGIRRGKLLEALAEVTKDVTKTVAEERAASGGIAA